MNHEIFSTTKRKKICESISLLYILQENLVTNMVKNLMTLPKEYH